MVHLVILLPIDSIVGMLVVCTIVYAVILSLSM